MSPAEIVHSDGSVTTLKLGESEIVGREPQQFRVEVNDRNGEIVDLFNQTSGGRYLASLWVDDGSGPKNDTRHLSARDEATSGIKSIKAVKE